MKNRYFFLLPFLLTLSSFAGFSSEKEEIKIDELSQNIIADGTNKSQEKANSIAYGGAFDLGEGKENILPLKEIYRTNSIMTRGKDIDNVVSSSWTSIKGFSSTTSGTYVSNGGFSSLQGTADFSQVNSIKGNFSYSEDATIRGYLGMRIYINSSTSYLFSLFSNGPVDDPKDEWPPVAIVRKNNSGDNISRTPLERNHFEQDKTFSMQVIIESGKVGFYLNDMEVWASETFETFASIQSVYIETNECPTTINSLKMGRSKLAFLNLEFSEQKYVEAFESENASIGYDNGNLVLTNNSEGNIKLISPDINVVSGHKYSMYLPLRNTFLFRMKNNSTSDKATIHFTTSKNGSFEETFDIKPNSDYQTYYFNISDLSVSGYLRGFDVTFLNSNSGSIYIDAITFEREEPKYTYAGEITSLAYDKKEEVVTMIGHVNSSYSRKMINIYHTDPRNFNWEAYNANNVFITSIYSDSNGDFEADFPLKLENENTSLLSRYILAVVDGIKVDEPKRIEYDAISTNNIQIPNREYNVLDFGALGDGFTDDTEAIQNTIDKCEKDGGGRIIIPGDDSEYGKRYIITHIETCDNAELNIGENAVLWQSERDEELNKTVPIHQRGYDTVTHGHDVDIDGLMWCHAHATVNLPLIFSKQKTNIRITGGGTIRLHDIGGEERNAKLLGGFIESVGIENRVLQIPLCFYECKNMDVINITVQRSNAWHCYMNFCENVYIGNYVEKEVCALTADGYTITSDKNVTLDHCVTYTSDDSVGICTAYNDPRGQFYRPSRPGKDNACENIEIKHCFSWGGFGISWIPWGTEAPNAYYEEIRNVEIHDCVLGGHKSTGCWPDDPFYGWSKTYTFTDTEDFDYCAIKDVHYYGNTYLDRFELSLGSIKLPITNLRVDDKNVPGNTHSPSIFLNENFDKKIRSGPDYADESNYVTGLCYWSERRFDKDCELGTVKIAHNKGYSGYIKGNGELFEGLFEPDGIYNVSFSTLLLSGEALLFARDAFTNEMLASKLISKSNTFIRSEMLFQIKEGTTLQLGIIHKGDTESILYLDDASIQRQSSQDRYSLIGQEETVSYSNFMTYGPYSGVNITDGKITTDDSAEYKIISRQNLNMTNYIVECDISASTAQHVDSGIYVGVKNPNSQMDMIDALNINVESDAGNSEYVVKIHRFSSKLGYLGALDTSNFMRIKGGHVHLKAIVKQSMLFVFVDNNEEAIMEYYIGDIDLGGGYGFRSFFAENEITNISLFVGNNEQPTDTDITNPREEFPIDNEDIIEPTVVTVTKNNRFDIPIIVISIVVPSIILISFILCGVLLRRKKYEKK